MNLEFSVNNNPVDIYYTTYNPLSGYSIPGYQCFYYLLTPTYSNFWTINVTPVTPGNTVKLYFVLIGHPGPGGSSNTEYESSGGGGATGAMGEGSISFNSNMALNLNFNNGYTSLSFAGDSEFCSVGSGQAGSDEYGTDNPGGNGTNAWINKDLSTPAVVNINIWGSAGGTGSNTNGSYGPNGQNYGDNVTASDNHLAAYVTGPMSDGTVFYGYGGIGGENGGSATSGGPLAQALFYYTTL